MSGRTTSRAKSGSFGDSRFANIRLNSDEVKHLQALVSEGKLRIDDVFDAVSSGFKFSLSRDDANNTYVASFTDRANGERGYSVILTGRGSACINAVYSLLYKHLVITEGLWLDIPDSSGGADFS